MDDAQLALSAIGQYDVAASPLQMAMVSAAIANDGVLMDPYLVSMVQAPDLKPLETHKPEVLSTAMTPEHAAELQQMMVVVVGRGHRHATPRSAGSRSAARPAPRSPIPSASRSPGSPRSRRVEDPKVAVAVIVEDADIPRDDIAGGRVAAPIAKAVMEAAAVHASETAADCSFEPDLAVVGSFAESTCDARG